MTLASISGAVAADGNVLVLLAPATAITAPDELTVAQLTAAGVKDITYDLAAGGFKWDTAQASVPNGRFTLAVDLSNPGIKTPSVSLQYVYGDADDVADPLIVEGEVYYLLVRWAIDHDQTIAIGDEFDSIKLKAGHKSKDSPAANTNLTKTTTFFPQGVPNEDFALAS